MTKPYVRPLLACAPMVGAVVGVRLLAGRYAWWALILEILAGALAYVISAFVIAGPQARDFLNLVMNVVRRRRGRAESDPPSDAPSGTVEEREA